MLAILIKTGTDARDAIVESWRFIDAVVQDMRQTREELEKQYGPLGF